MINNVTYLLLLLACVCFPMEFTGTVPEEVTDNQSVPDGETVIGLNDRLTKKVAEWGFELKTYDVETKDDYFLKIHRLAKNKNDKKLPVLIMHGITGCSTGFVASKRSLAYYLVERGYDVWLGNARGTVFSMKHRHLNPNERKFWNFSFHEVGYHDVPAFLRKITAETGAPSVHYVGFSMGATAFLVMATTQVPSLGLVASVTLLAPVAIPRHYSQIASTPKRLLATIGLNILNFFGRGDMYAYHKYVSLAIFKACSNRVTAWMCEKYFRRESCGRDIYDHESHVQVLPFKPCGASIKTYVHFMQTAHEGKFQQYDYGKDNQAIHGQPTPPGYDLGLIDNKVYMLAGGQDGFADIRDIKWLQSQLKSSVLISKRFEDFDHRDFMYSTQASVLYETILEIVESYEEKRNPRGIQNEE